MQTANSAIQLPGIIVMTGIFIALLMYPCIFWRQKRLEEAKFFDGIRLAAQAVAILNALKTVIVITVDYAVSFGEFRLGSAYELWGSYAVMWAAFVTIKNIFKREADTGKVPASASLS